MGDFLDTIVYSQAEWDDASKTTRTELWDPNHERATQSMLSLGMDVRGRCQWRDRIKFELPIQVHLQVFDRIVFYHGTVRMPGGIHRHPRITHDDYFSASVYRAEDTTYLSPEEIMKSAREHPEKWTCLMEFDSRDMKLLTDIHKYAESFMGEQIHELPEGLAKKS